MVGPGFSGIYTEGDYGDYKTIKKLPSTGHLLVTVTPTQATVDYVRSGGTGGAYSYTIAPNSPPTCDGDFDIDQDVDGSDLAKIASGQKTWTDSFAGNFGKTTCP